MNDKYYPKVLDIQSVCLVRVPLSSFHVIGDTIISSILSVCRTYQNILCVHCDSSSQRQVRVQKTHYPIWEIDTLFVG